MSAVNTLRQALYGSPPSPSYKPDRDGVINAFTQVTGALESLFGVTSVQGAVIERYRSTLVGYLTPVSGTIGLVWGDDVVDFNGIYVKSGASGEGYWTFTNLLGVGPRGPGPTNEQVMRYGAVYATANNSGNTIIATTVPALGLDDYEDNQEFLIKLSLNQGTPSVSIPKLKIDDGPELGIYDEVNALPDLSQFRSGAFLRVRKSAAFGGLFQQVNLKVARQLGTVIYCQHASESTPNALVLSPVGDPVLAEQDGAIFEFQMQGDATVAVPTIKIGNLPVRQIYNDEANLLPLGYMRKARRYQVTFRSSFGGLYTLNERTQVRSPYENARQGTAEAKRGLRDLYRAVNPAPTTLVEHWRNDFTNQADCDQIKIAHGSRDYTQPASYDSYTYDAVSGAARAVLTDNGGMWSDGNHDWPGPGILNLLSVFNFAQASGPIPNLTDASNVRFELDIQLRNFLLPPGCHIILHTQGIDPVSMGGTGKRVNLFHHRMLDEALGFGGYGFGWPHQRNDPLVDTGVRTIAFDFVPNDGWWHQLGGAVSRYDTYAAGPPTRLLEGGQLDNIQVQILYPMQDDRLSMMPIRAEGEVLLHSARLLKPA